MINYLDRNYQDHIIDEYILPSSELCINRLASISNLAVSYFKKDCILYGCDVFIIEKSLNQLVFCITPGKFLIDNILVIIDNYLIIDYLNLNNTIDYIFISSSLIDNQYNVTINCDLPEQKTNNYIVLAGFRLYWDSFGYRIYGNILTTDYKQELTINIEPNIQFVINYDSISRIGYSKELDNYKRNINNVEYYISPSLDIDPKILLNLNKYLNSQTKVPKYMISDYLTYSPYIERISRLSNSFFESDVDY